MDGDFDLPISTCLTYQNLLKSCGVVFYWIPFDSSNFSIPETTNPPQKMTFIWKKHFRKDGASSTKYIQNIYHSILIESFPLPYITGRQAPIKTDGSEGFEPQSAALELPFGWGWLMAAILGRWGGGVSTKAQLKRLGSVKKKNMFTLFQLDFTCLEFMKELWELRFVFFGWKLEDFLMFLNFPQQTITKKTHQTPRLRSGENLSGDNPGGCRLWLQYYMGVEPKIGGNTPKWMVKIMEHPIF